jgi:hypothetical protein
VIARADGLFRCQADKAIFSLEISKIDRLISIVVETEKNGIAENFSAKSKGKIFDGSLVGFRHSEEKFCD